MTITARYASTCPTCSQPIQPGTQVEWSKGSPAKHTSCSVASAPAPTLPMGYVSLADLARYVAASGPVRKTRQQRRDEIAFFDRD